MGRLLTTVVALGVGFIFFGSFVTSKSGVAIYLKKEASLNYIVTEIGTVTNVERLILTFNNRYSLLVVGYNERDGVRFFETMPALP